MIIELSSFRLFSDNTRTPSINGWSYDELCHDAYVMYVVQRMFKTFVDVCIDVYPLSLWIAFKHILYTYEDVCIDVYNILCCHEEAISRKGLFV